MTQRGVPPSFVIAAGYGSLILACGASGFLSSLIGGQGWIGLIVAVLPMVILGISWVYLYRYGMRKAHPPAGFCPFCGYDLKGLTRGAVCPECGMGSSSA